MDRLLSLWDIVNQFDLKEFGDMTARWERFAAVCENLATLGGRGGHHDPMLYQLILKELNLNIAFARENDFGECLDVLLASEEHFRLHRRMAEIAALGTAAAQARDAWMSAAKKRMFLRVASGRAAYVDNSALFGPEVYDAFPSARPDIRDAGNCLAADCNTAAVFHLMRAVEWGLRALCVRLGFNKLRTKNKKTGKVTYKLIEYSEWETILNQLQERVDKKLGKVRRGPEKQLAQEFYYPVLQDIRGIRDAWRNHTMHTRSDYTASDADAILEHVRRLMTTLASHAPEV